MENSRMQRAVRGWLTFALVGACLVGCEAPGVGDPCEPEQVPTTGFVATEAYLETSSVQCRTRVCMVYKLEGDPRDSCQAGGMQVCSSDEEVAQRVYCTCRCRAPSSSTAPTCECPDGFSCVDLLELGGDGIRGGYCVKSSTVTAED